MELVEAIGARLRAARAQAGWTLDRLAEESGVSRRTLVQLEQGATNPSVGTLLRLAQALGVGLPSLVEPPSATLVRVTRAGDGAVLWRGEHGGRGVLVATSDPPAPVELWDWTLGPGDRHDSEPHTTGTREVLHVLEGALVVDAGEPVGLGAGDALALRGDVPHSYASATGARFSLAVLDPGPTSRGPARA